jgi:hypothetical protein
LILSLRRLTPAIRKTSATSIVAFVLPATSPCVAQTFSLPSRILRDGPSPSSPTQAPPAVPPTSQGKGKDDAWGRQFYLQVRRCWRRPSNYDREPVEAIYKIKLTRSGRLEGAPKLLQSPRTEYEKRYHASALAALVTCQPYDLPQDAYDRWRHFEPVFRELRR